MEHSLPIDFQHYLEHHLSQPILRIFEPLMNNAKSLLTGDGPLVHSLSLSRCATAVWGAVTAASSERESNVGLKAVWGSGDHTRAIQVSTPSLASGGIMKFAKVKLTCMSCKAVLCKGDTTLCEHCKPKASSLAAHCLPAA